MKQGRKVSAIAVGLALSGLTSLSPAYAQQADEEAAKTLQPMARQRYPSEVWDQMQRLF